MSRPSGSLDTGRPRHRTRAVIGVALVAFVALIAGCSCSSDNTASPPGTIVHTDKRPNVVVIMTDDQTLTDMQFMPKTKSLIGDQGTTFPNNFVSFPLCCPSRATAVTGQYAHNTHVLNNVPPDGGFDKLDSTNTLPVWLQKAGYNTAHVGKYLNGYGEKTTPVVPPGYTDWFGLIDPSELLLWDYNVLDNGKTVHYGTDDKDYQTDVLAARAEDNIKKFSQQDKPFYMTVWPLAPHSAQGKGVPIFTSANGKVSVPNPIAPAPRPSDVGHFKDLKYPHGPSYMEQDLSDKPPSIQGVKDLITQGLGAQGLTLADVEALINQTYEARAESLIAVDDLVEGVVNSLKDNGQLDNTIIMFTSDNGWLLGEHGIPFAKVVLYEEAVRVPFLARGPGFPAGTLSKQLTANIDVAPTIAAAAGVTPGLTVDGIDIRPQVANATVNLNRAVLLEEFSHKPTYKAVRVAGYMYAEYDDGSSELYDLFKDPYQLESKVNDPAYAKAKARLATALHQLSNCAGAACQVEIPRSELNN